MPWNRRLRCGGALGATALFTALWSVAGCELPVACDPQNGNSGCPTGAVCGENGYCTSGGDGDGDGDGGNGSPCAQSLCQALPAFQDVEDPVELAAAGASVLVVDRGTGFSGNTNLWSYTAGSTQRRSLLAGRDDIHDITLGDNGATVYALDSEAGEVLAVNVDSGEGTVLLDGLNSGYDNNDLVYSPLGYIGVLEDNDLHRVSQAGVAAVWDATGIPYHLARAGEFFYYMSGSTVRRVPVTFAAGDEEDAVASVSMGLEAVKLAVGHNGIEDYVYFATKVKDERQGQIWRIGIDGGVSQTLTTTVDPEGAPDADIEVSAMAVSERYVYYATEVGDDSRAEAIFQVPTAGGVPERLALAPSVRSLALVAGQLYLAVPGGVSTLPLNP